MSVHSWCICSIKATFHALQIEALIMEMQNPDTGIKTQTQRVMITNIPHAVAGKNFSKGRAVAKFSKQSCVRTPCPSPGYCCMDAWSPGISKLVLDPAIGSPACDGGLELDDP